MEKGNSSIAETAVSEKRLALLRQRLSQVMSVWTVKDYNAFVMFFVRILPTLFDAERCTIFIIEIGSEKICSMYGTGIEGEQIEPPRQGSVVGEVISTGKGTLVDNLDKRVGYHTHLEEKTGFVTRSMACVPIKNMTDHGVTGAIQILNKKTGSSFDKTDLLLLEEVAGYLSNSIESIILNQEIMRLSNQLNREVSKLDRRFAQQNLLIAESLEMREIVSLAGEISASPVNVLLQGENGTGKELVARLIHELSDRRDKPFIAVNCAAIPENLVESEFFGFTKGAFSGADAARKGRFEEAEGGTLFLDEIAEMPMTIQPKFLRVLQEREGMRLGSSALVKYDFRVISATNKDLALEKDQGNFREDLFFRLFSIDIHIPPLRKRRDDVLPMAAAFLAEIANRFNKKIAGFSTDVLGLFECYSWPGNVRQLYSEIERLVALTKDGEMIQVAACSRELLSHQAAYPADALHLSGRASEYSLPENLQELEVLLITKALRKTGGNKSHAARLLEITRQGLMKKMKRHGIDTGK